MKITKSAPEITRAFGSSTTFNNSGGSFPPGTDTIQDAIDAIAGGMSGLYLTVTLGGQGTVQALGTLGATETIDLANANYFYGTLDQDCTLSLTGWTTGKDSQITVEVTEDGTGGWTPTFSGVTWIGGTTPTHDTTAGSVSLYIFLSRDGGTTIYGALVGSGTASGTFVLTTDGGEETITAHGNTGSTETFFSSGTGNVHTATINAACTATFASVTSGKACSFSLVLTQDGTGSRIMTWPGSVVWPGGITPTLATAAGAIDILTFFTLDGGTIWYGFPTGSSGSALTIKDEGTPLATAATSLDFVGPGVTASGTGAAKTITILSTGIQLASITAASSAIAATEAVVVSASLAAGSIVAGNSYRITGAGIGTTGVTPGTDTFRIRIGPTTLTGTIPTSTTALGVAAVTGQSFNFVAIVTIRTSGASGTIIGECVAFSANVATGRYATLNNLSATTASVALDTTVTNLLELTFQSGNAGSSNTFQIASIEQLVIGAGTGDPYTSVPWSSGTSMPGSPATGQRITRTDLGIDFYYDGTRWLSVTLYRSALAMGDSANPFSTGGGQVASRYTPWHTTFDLWLDTLYSSTYVVTTNDGSKYWTASLVKYTAAASPTTIVTFNTSADTASNFVTHATAIGAALGTTNKTITVELAKTSTPGAMYLSAALAYRLIGV